MRTLLSFLLAVSLVAWVAPSVARAQPVKPHILMIFDTSGSMLSGSCDGSASRIYNVKAAMYQALFYAGTDEANFGLMRFPQFEDACHYNGCSFPSYEAGYYLINSTQTGGANNHTGCKLSTHSNQTTYGTWFDNGADQAIVVPVTNPAAGLDPGGPGNFDPADGNISEILRWLDTNEGCSGGSITDPEIKAMPQQWTPLGRSLFYARMYYQNYVLPHDDPVVAPCRQNVVILLTDGAESCDSSTSGFNPTTCSGGTEFNPYRQACLLHQMGIPVYLVVTSSSSQANNIASYGGTGSALVANFTDQDAVKSALLSIIADAVPSGETCNGLDDNCNGQVDEGVKNQCGSYPAWCATEACNGVDDDCDGQVDEGLPLNACGGPCGVPVPAEITCNGIDDDCDPTTPDEPVGCLCGQEFCDGVDNDCDGLIDQNDPDYVQGNEPCGPNPPLGECRAGTLQCNYPGAPTCTGAVYPTAETCDGRDENCNGIVDDVVYSPPECVIPNCQTACCDGHWECVGGQDTCVPNAIQAAEECNGLDDDCDGRIDEGAACPQPDVCWFGACEGRIPPDGCGPGLVQRDGLCVHDPCRGTVCPGGTICEPSTGDCVDPCDPTPCTTPGTACDVTLATCDASGTCTADDSACVTADCYLDPSLCVDGEVCEGGVCVPDPCFGTGGVDCGVEACRDATCIATCVGVECGIGERCEDGLCVVADCGTFSCPPGQSCVDGQCAQNPCGGVTCGAGRVCKAGVCVDDPCRLVVCPTGSVCADGQCVGSTTDGGVVWPDAGPRPEAGPAGDAATGTDGGAPDDFRITAGGGGCACQSGGGAGDGHGTPVGLALCLGMGLGLLWRRRRSHHEGKADQEMAAEPEDQAH